MKEKIKMIADSLVSPTQGEEFRAFRLRTMVVLVDKIVHRKGDTIRNSQSSTVDCGFAASIVSVSGIHGVADIRCIFDSEPIFSELEKELEGKYITIVEKNNWGWYSDFQPINTDEVELFVKGTVEKSDFVRKFFNLILYEVKLCDREESFIIAETGMGAIKHGDYIKFTYASLPEEFGNNCGSLFYRKGDSVRHTPFRPQSVDGGIYPDDPNYIPDDEEEVALGVDLATERFRDGQLRYETLTFQYEPETEPDLDELFATPDDTEFEDETPVDTEEDTGEGEEMVWRHTGDFHAGDQQRLERDIRLEEAAYERAELIGRIRLDDEENIER